MTRGPGLTGGDRPAFGFRVAERMPKGLGRTGVMSSPHGEIRTRAFVVFLS